LQQLLSAYEAAASGALSLADRLSTVFSDIDQDAAIFGGSLEDTFNKKFSAIIAGLPAPPGTGGGTPAGAFDLTTQAGREEARKALQDLARTDPTLKALIIDLIRDLDSLPDLPTDIADALGEQGATGTSVTAGLQTMTVFQGDHLITLEESQLLVQRQIHDLIASASSTRGLLLQPPSLASITSPAAVGGGGTSFHLHLGPITVPAGTEDPQAFGTAVGDAAMNRILGDELVRQRFFSGSTQVI